MLEGAKCPKTIGLGNRVNCRVSLMILLCGERPQGPFNLLLDLLVTIQNLSEQGQEQEENEN